MNGILNKFSNFYVFAALVGFLLVSILPSLFGLSGTSFSIFYRIFILGSSLLIIFFSATNKNPKVIFKPFYLFLLFWALYACRLIYDLSIADGYIEYGKSNSEYFQLAFGVAFVPAIGIIYADFNKLDFDFILVWVYRVLFLVLLIAIVLRTGSTVTARSTGGLEIGVLLYGQYGTTLCLLSLFMLMKNSVTLKSIFYIVGFIIGFITIFVSASRSPFLALIIATLMFIFIRKGGVRTLFVSLILFCFFYFFFFDIAQLLNNYYPSSFLGRLLYAVNEGESGGRESLFAHGFNEFIDNPFFGNAMLLQTGLNRGKYPHNLIIEAFMATGFLGGIIFTLWILKCVTSLKKIVSKNFNQSWIGLLFIQFLIFGMFSGSLFSSNLFWLISVLLVGVSNIKGDYSVSENKH
jgi:O-antigen ligase